ncbi:restriction endonuclease subunit S [Pseudoxanthomonas sp. SL93]|uniref:restriction endonuclease subunit S n=1 Tax=Pseudoxanthomonas sp. SL93 TaxID=2995142 RepID=UPI00226E052A|nr:restriction endonuclease subunit S [Pseudoxanthomonas sp. SL93]WAC64623.1 restriction endonuclease subunit S [Pseudoxanthomonas sp. SL93]
MAKQRKAMVKPKLRFPEFKTRSGWKSEALGDVSTPVTERVGERNLTPVSISAGVGFIPQAEKFGRDISGNQYKVYTLVRDGDFVYNKGNSLKFPQGCVYQLRGLGEVAAPNVFIAFRLGKDQVGEFFQFAFERNIHGVQLKNHITSGARSNGLLNVSREQFFDVRIPSPLRDEQQKIADCLASLDEVIVTQGRKIEALKAHKNGLMQQLFPREDEARPRLRFPEFRNVGEWLVEPAAKFFLNRKEKGEPGLPIYSVTMNDGMIPRASFDRDFYDIEDPSGNKKVHAGDIVYNTMRMWQGAQGVALEDCMVSPAYVVLTPRTGVFSKFFFYLFKLRQTLELLTAYSRGLTEDRLRLYFEDFSRVPLRVPGPEEQKRIADCLSSLDAQIAAELSRLAVLRIHKNGLLQQLFPAMKGR